MSGSRVVRKIPVIMLGFLLCLGVLLVSGLFSARALAKKTGTSGDCTWEYKDEGGGEIVFRLYPTSGAEGTISWTGENAPWNNIGDADYYRKVTRVIIDKPVKLTSAAGMFWAFSSVRTMDLSGLVTDDVQNFTKMFQDCKSITHLNLSGLKTGNATDMTEMFFRCESLKEIDVTGWDMSNVKSLHSMFLDCKVLEKIKGMETWTWKADPKLESMETMFAHCRALKEVDVSRLKTDNVTTMKEMFLECEALPFLDVGGWNVEKVTAIVNLFNGCHALEKITGIDRWNAQSLTSVFSAFKNCYKLKELRLNKWNISKITSLYHMFLNCHSLERLEVNEWDVSKATMFSNTFHGCSSLTELDVSKWNVSSVEVNNMVDCFNMDGGDSAESASLRHLDISGSGWVSTKMWPGTLLRFIGSPYLSVLKASNQMNLDRHSGGETFVRNYAGSSEYTGSKSGTVWQQVDEANGGTIDKPVGKTFDDLRKLGRFNNQDGAYHVETYVRVSPSQYFIFDKNSLEATGKMDSQIIAVGKKGNIKESSFSRPGHRVVSWNTKADGTGETYNIGQEYTNPGSNNKRPIVLYARWEKDDQGGTDGGSGTGGTDGGSGTGGTDGGSGTGDGSDYGSRGNYGSRSGRGGEGRSDGWQRHDGSVFYYRNGQKLIGWHELSGTIQDSSSPKKNWFYFADNGVMLTGRHNLVGGFPNRQGVQEKHWFGLDERTGVQLRGWHKVGSGSDEKWYYYKPEDGTGLVGRHYIPGGFANAQGVQEMNWFFFDLGTGAEIRGWHGIIENGVENWYYYRDGDGIMLKGQHELVGGFDQRMNWFYFDEVTGIEVRGWKYIDYQDKWCYYRDGDGIMLKGQHELPGGDDGGMNWFYFDEETGAEFRNTWKDIPSQDKTCYYGSDGAMYKGWRSVDDENYYFDEETGAVK